MKVNNLLPKVYYKESRDFSFIARLLEILGNYAKTNIDIINVNVGNENVPSMILDLLTLTLGFESKHKYITKDLVYIASTFTELVRNKGNIEAIRAAIQLLLASQSIPFGYDIEIDSVDKHLLNITVPEEMTDLILLEDLFEYILPAGTTYKFVKANIVDSGNSTVIYADDTVSHEIKTDIDLGNIAFVNGASDNFDVIHIGGDPSNTRNDIKSNTNTSKVSNDRHD